MFVLLFWQELTATVRHARSTVDLPMVIAGDANVWLPYFSLGCSRSVDNLVVPFIDLLITSCGLRLINPPDEATYVSGAALDLMLISSHCPCSMLVQSGLAMLRGSSWLLPHNGFRPLPVRGICFIDSQACSRPVSTFAPSAQLVLNSTSVTLRASPEMVRGGTIIGIQIPRCTLDSERLVWHSIEQCARLVARFGRNGNLV